MSEKQKVSLKTKIIRIILLVGTVTSMFFVPWPILWMWLQPLPDTIPEQLEIATEHGFDGIIVYVDQTGKEPGFYAAGWHNKEKQIPADPHAIFKIASITKLYDAVAIAKLVHEGKLSLDGTLAEYFPELKDRIEYADQITLRLMVQHRSGIPNFTDTYNYWVAPKETSDENLALILDQPASFKPDHGYEYSNTNYLLIGRLIEKVTGGDKFEYIKKKILDPLGLKNTFASIHDVNMEDVMSGYYVGYPDDLKTNDVGGIFLATAEDVGKFLRALNDGSVFEDGEKEIYSSIYGYEHTGLIPGYQSIARYHPDIDAVVIQFTNTVDFQGYTWDISVINYNRVVKILRRQN